MKFALGDKVAYSVQWLKSVGMSHSDLARARGTVTGIQPLGQRQLVSVDWGTDDIPGKVIADNLAKVGANRRFCNVD